MADVILSEQARRDLRRLAQPYLRAVQSAVDRLASEPSAGKTLHGDLEGLRSLRIGNYRVIYVFDPRRQRVEIVWIRHRREAYR